MYRLILFIAIFTVGTSFAQKPTIEFDPQEINFGASGTGIQTCLFVVVKNVTMQSQTIVSLSSTDPHFTIPSPSQEMMPIKLRRGGTMTISVCFTPDKVSTYSTELLVRTGAAELIKVPLKGKGIKPEDVSKLPQTELSVTPPKKKQKDHIISLKLPKASKLLLQLSDALGNIIKTYVNSELMNEGNYEFAFTGLDSEGKPLEAGTYYVRMTGSERYTNKEIKITKMFSFKP